MKSLKMKFVSLVVVLLSVSCAHIPKDDFDREYQVGAYLWFQTSGEYRALSYQAYNLGKMKLDRDLENKHNRKRAIVLDLDETVLDNSFGGADEIQRRENWTKDSFNKWVSKKSATALPGAVEFLKYAHSRQVEIFYISNRLLSQKDDTYDNLVSLGIPVKKENLLLLSEKWGKEQRRQVVLAKYDVVLFFGDNLGDFHKDWDDKSSDERRALVDAHRDDFGEKFIIIPNPLYGDWEKSLPKNKKRTELLKTHP